MRLRSSAPGRSFATLPSVILGSGQLDGTTGPGQTGQAKRRGWFLGRLDAAATLFGRGDSDVSDCCADCCDVADLQRRDVDTRRRNGAQKKFARGAFVNSSYRVDLDAVPSQRRSRLEPAGSFTAPASSAAGGSAWNSPTTRARYSRDERLRASTCVSASASVVLAIVREGSNLSTGVSGDRGVRCQEHSGVGLVYERVKGSCCVRQVQRHSPTQDTPLDAIHAM